ncbi:TnsA endonuclease N-terminal domain-containing protein [Alteromonas sp. ASW11-130]|uniref:TnsA endonuclease N-terminal domain-containing protein n=1 Tax=Alteromonas sp. ASW11-130 TaxID=3015775 RepID=UPI002241AD75|nr:TnsA endonuclease N-terminal domain-containing protein [Alteromonas sp. ASW11-130]MCW8093220.1 TnsA endonuclease N-terminal domain-containing protein [Alteromonas sp. ASW11-130]
MTKMGWLTKAEVKKRFDSGRGVGRGLDYQPWIRIQEISSDGTSYRALSHTSGRVVHLLSKLEFLTFSLCDWNENICDIREQYPFDLETSLEVAEKAGIKHPQKGNKFHVFTTDLLLNWDPLDNKRTAIQVKYVKDLMDRETVAKLEIERRCCMAKGIEWQLITELDIPRIHQANVDWILGGKDLHLEEDFETGVMDIWCEISTRPELKLAKACADYDKRHGQPSGESLRLVRNAFACRILIFDISLPYQNLVCGDLISISPKVSTGGLYAIG